MATETTNYHLKKPAQEDFYDVADFNANMDIIDTALKGNADATVIAKSTADTAQATANTAQATADIAQVIVRSQDNLLINSNFTDRNAIVDQRQGYILPPNAVHYSNSTMTSNAVIITAYTPIYHVTVRDTYASFRLSTDSSASLRYVSTGFLRRGYMGTDYGVDMLRGFAAADHYVLQSNGGLRFPDDTTNNGIIKRIPEFQSLSGKQLTLSVLLPSLTGSVTVAYASGTPFAQTSLGTITTAGVHNFSFTAPDLTGKDYFGIRVYAASNTTTSYTLGAICLLEGENQTGFYKNNSNQWQPAWTQNYGDELLRCQRYFQVYRTQSLRPTYAADCRPTMAKDPVQSTAVIGGATHYTNSAEP